MKVLGTWTFLFCLLIPWGICKADTPSARCFGTMQLNRQVVAVNVSAAPFQGSDAWYGTLSVSSSTYAYTALAFQGFWENPISQEAVVMGGFYDSNGDPRYLITHLYQFAEYPQTRGLVGWYLLDSSGNFLQGTGIDSHGQPLLVAFSGNVDVDHLWISP